MRGQRRIAPRARLCAAAGLLACSLACAAFPENPPLSRVDPQDGYRFDRLALGPGNTDESFVIVTLSGGGTRAAALSFGTLQALDAVPLERGGATLLDEVDVISSVSGGSFAAAYYGLFGKQRFFAEFREQVLLRRIERDLLLRVFAPWNWWKLASLRYGRGDLADAYYGRHIFESRRFGDLPAERPFIQLNATDLSLGTQLSFIQDHFDRLCSDLDGVQVSRGVTASSAFPIAFAPLTLRNHPKDHCDYQTPRWVENALAYDLEVNTSRYDRARVWKSYEDPAREYVHVNDGGLADNIGLRGPLLGLQSPAAPIKILRRMNEDQIARVVMILVDADPESEPTLDASARPPGIVTVLTSSATNPLNNYSADTIALAHATVRSWNLQWAGEKPPIAFYAIHVRFETHPDPAVREALKGTPTRLQLDPAQVDLLIESAGVLLDQSPFFQCLRAAVAGAPPPEGDLADFCPEK